MTSLDSNAATTTSAQILKSGGCETTWADLLAQAVTEPSLILAAYSRFWNYSLGNQLLAILQCRQRGLEPGRSPPSPAGRGWDDMSRRARRG